MSLYTVAHEQDKFRAAAADGLAMTHGLPVQSPAAGAQDFRGADLLRIGEECLRRNNYPGNLSSKPQIADAMLKSMNRPEAAVGNDDLTNIVKDVANKSLLKGYQESPRTFLPIIRQVSASDFKTIYGVALSEAPDLELVNEHGEYKSGELKDKNENYSVKTYGKIIYLTRQMLVNDDTGALTRVPQMLGNAAARRESDEVWALITSNPTMNEDGKTLFHTDHGNLEDTTADKGHVDSTKLQAARAAIRKQTGPNGATLDLQPRYLIVPVAQETDSEVVARSRANPEDNKNSQVYNPWTSLIPIAEPRLDKVSEDAWYLAADPNQVDLIEMAYLGDSDEPYIEQEPMFQRDATGFKVRHEFGAGVMDYRGLFKNPGA